MPKKSQTPCSPGTIIICNSEVISNSNSHSDIIWSYARVAMSVPCFWLHWGSYHVVFERIQRRSIRPYSIGHRDVGSHYGLRAKRDPFCLSNPSRLGPRAVFTCISSPCYLVLFLWHSKDWSSMAHGILSVCYDNCTPIKERVQSEARTDGVPQAEGWAKCPCPACHRIEKPGNNTEKSGDSRKLDMRPVNVLRLYLQYLSHLVQASPIMPCRPVSRSKMQP